MNNNNNGDVTPLFPYKNLNMIYTSDHECYNIVTCF